MNRKLLKTSSEAMSGCVKMMQKLLVRVETEEWVYEAYELS